MTDNFNNSKLNKQVINWKGEEDMRKWLQNLIDRYIIKERNKQHHISVGNWDHYYKNIRIFDKWIRDNNANSYPTNINKFIDKVYKANYKHLKISTNEVKFLVIVVVDSRKILRDLLIKRHKLKDCFDFRVNIKDGIISAIFVIEVVNKFL